MDRHVKYQSAINSNWFIGFDKLGNPIRQQPAQVDKRQATDNNVDGQHQALSLDSAASSSGQTIETKRLVATESLAANHEPQLEAIGRERCYLFTKLNRLTTSTQVFPEALELIAATDNHSHLLLLSSSSSSSSSSSPSNKIAAIEHEIKTYRSAQIASLAKKRGNANANPVLHTFNQGQLINMARYRNILRYQMGRLAGQSILPDYDDQQQPKYHHQATSFNNYSNDNKMASTHKFEPRALTASA